MVKILSALTEDQPMRLWIIGQSPRQASLIRCICGVEPWEPLQGPASLTQRHEKNFCVTRINMDKYV